MAALLPTVQARINHLRCCKNAGMGGDAYLNCVRETTTIIINCITNFRHSIPVESASALITSVVDDPNLFSLADRQAIVESINEKTSQNDHVPAVADQRGNDRFGTEKLMPRQSMYHVENYFTQKIWTMLRESNSGNRTMVYLEIGRLLASVGMQRPQEKFWGHLVGTLQWALEGRLDNPLRERDALKRMFVQCRAVMNYKPDAPIEYPKDPNTLLEEYPGVYHHAYKNQPPMPPPYSLDTHTLNVLKASIGCRSTRKYNGAVLQAQQARHLG